MAWSCALFSHVWRACAAAMGVRVGCRVFADLVSKTSVRVPSVSPQVAGRSCTRRGAGLGRARSGHVGGCARRTCDCLMFVARAPRRRAFVSVAARMRSDFDAVGLGASACPKVSPFVALGGALSTPTPPQLGWQLVSGVSSASFCQHPASGGASSGAVHFLSGGALSTPTWDALRVGLVFGCGPMLFLFAREPAHEGGGRVGRDFRRAASGDRGSPG